MPLKSKAQRRKFAELLLKGDITEEAFERWNRETGSAELPERVGDLRRKPAKKTKRTKRATRTKRTIRAKKTKRKARAKRPSSRGTRRTVSKRKSAVRRKTGTKRAAARRR